MSTHSEDAITCLAPASESFWEPGNYKKTSKRIEDGFKLCNDLVELVQERCDIEKNYAKCLHQWSKRWNDAISRGPEYGTSEAAWKGFLSEADGLSDLHNRIKEKLTTNVINRMKQWQKDKYHKSMIHFKEKKEIDDEFKKVQKPWAKLLDRVRKSKHDYHMACKIEKTLAIQERNATSDSSMSPDQLLKIRDRVSRAHEEASRFKERYETALKDISQYNPKYVTGMTRVFEKCQEMEEQRLNFFKETLFNVHDCLDISKDPSLTVIYDEFRHTLQNADASKDLRWWSNTYGIGMNMQWPRFEAFSEEFRDIIKDHKARRITTASSDGITLINQHRFRDELPEWSESFATNDTLTDNGELGIAVKALYDYEGAEADELSFKRGDVFEKLEEEDEQGWCKGRKDSRVGLYPANYVEVMTITGSN